MTPTPRSSFSLSTLVVGVFLSLICIACDRKAPLPTMGEEPPTPFGEPLDQPLSEDPPQDQRAASLRENFLADNHALMLESPELTAGKFLKMASHPYNYFRGSVAIWLRDTYSSPENFKPFEPFITSESGQMLIAVDPHPENFGTFLNHEGKVVLGVNDFDSASWGPYHIDLRRLGIGVALLCRVMLGDLLTKEAQDRIIRASLLGYLDEIQGKSTLQAAFSLGEGKRLAGEVFGDLIRRAERDGAQGEALDEYAPLSEDKKRREMFLGTLERSEVEGIWRDHLVEVPGSVEKRLTGMLRSYQKTQSWHTSPRYFELKGLSQRLGAGVSSYPVQRYYLLVEGPTEGLGDDVILEFKEMVAPPTTLPRRGGFGEFERAGSNAEWVVRAQRALQRDAGNDTHLGWAKEGKLSMKVKARTKYQKGIDVHWVEERVRKGKWDVDVLVQFAQSMGHFLAQMHQRSVTKGGKPKPVEGLAKVIKDRERFMAQMVRLIDQDLEDTMEDYDRFKMLLRQHGSDLGHRN